MKGEPEIFVFLRRFCSRFCSRFTFSQHIFKLLALTVFFSFITILKSESNQSPKTIRLVTPSNTVDTVISEVVLREAYQRLGYKVELTKFPAERSLILADKGIFDGEVQRIDGLSKNYPNLIQVFPATNFVEGSVFTLIENLKIERWENLRPYEVGIIRGIKFAEKSTDGMRRHVVGEYETLFVMLQNKRFDLVVSPRLNGIYQLKLMAMTSVYEIEPPLERKRTTKQLRLAVTEV